MGTLNGVLKPPVPNQSSLAGRLFVCASEIWSDFNRFHIKLKCHFRIKTLLSFFLHLYLVHILVIRRLCCICSFTPEPEPCQLFGHDPKPPAKLSPPGYAVPLAALILFRMKQDERRRPAEGSGRVNTSTPKRNSHRRSGQSKPSFCNTPQIELSCFATFASVCVASEVELWVAGASK